MARRRRLSPEERALWDRVAATAVPMHGSAGAAPDSVAEPEAPPKPPASPPRPRPRPERPSAPARVAVDLAPSPPAALARANPQMDRRRLERLRRGRLEPEARLDLHGMTADSAHAALTAFVLSAHGRDLRLLLVITGKGRSEDATAFPRQRGILRHSVPHWLAAPPLGGRILEVAPAHAKHGGAGAYYIYLRRRR